MSGRLSQLNNLEQEIFEEYVEIIEDEEPEVIRTPEGDFDNQAWLEAEADEVLDERDRLEEVSKLNGGTIDID